MSSYPPSVDEGGPVPTQSRDHLSPESRSRNMAAVKGRDTKPEIQVRSLLHRRGFRFRRNVSSLPGRPDIVLPKYRAVILVNGCYWHRHACKRGRSVPTARREFWTAKFDATVLRDRHNEELLQAAGWRARKVWECELRADAEFVADELADWIRMGS